MSPGPNIWRIVHPNGYTSPEYDELPRKINRTSRGAIAVATSRDVSRVADVLEWSGVSWRELNGPDREFALDWIRSVLTDRRRDGTGKKTRRKDR